MTKGTENRYLDPRRLSRPLSLSQPIERRVEIIQALDDNPGNSTDVVG